MSSSGFPTLSPGDTCRRNLLDRQVQRYTHDGVAVDPEQQLVPLAFALAESENDDSWSWFMRLIHINILGPM
jgi:hypothetical protein